MKKLCLASLCALALVAACSRPVAQEEPIRAVRVVTVAVQAPDARFEYAADVRPRVESRLGFRVGGKIIRRQAEVGQRVKAGQLLAQLDPQDFLLADSAARAQVAAALSNRDLATAEFQRYKTLKDQNFISGAELDRRARRAALGAAHYTGVLALPLPLPTAGGPDVLTVERPEEAPADAKGAAPATGGVAVSGEAPASAALAAPGERAPAAQAPSASEGAPEKRDGG
jgi:hypothetical protein